MSVALMTWRGVNICQSLPPPSLPPGTLITGEFIMRPVPPPPPCDDKSAFMSPPPSSTTMARASIASKSGPGTRGLQSFALELNLGNSGTHS